MREGGSVGAVLESALDILINIISVLLSAEICRRLIAGVRAEGAITVLSAVFSAVLAVVFYAIFDIYRPLPYVKAAHLLSDSVIANSAAYGLIFLVSLAAYGTIPRLYLFAWAFFSYALSSAILLIKKRAIIAIVSLARRRSGVEKRIILVGDGADSTRAFIREFKQNERGGIVLLGGVFDGDFRDSACPRLGSLSELFSVLDREEPDFAVFCLDGYDRESVIRMVRGCDERCIKVYFTPVIFGYFKSAKQVEYIGSLPIINAHRTPLDSLQNALIKRALDLVLSLAMIILLSPLMLAISVGVAISLGRPILFKQERVGRMGKPFRMLKFRSMREGGDGQEWTTGVDRRKTRFGNFLRRYSLDELPQLFNVLFGSMSLVGPRPELSHFVERFKEKIPLYMVKHYVKPGITGLAQIKGLRGDTSIEERINEDIAYIEGWTLLLDIKILLKTPMKMINKSEVYTDGDKK